MTASKTVCVTGASGFITSHIVSQLLEKGYNVRGTVRDASNETKTAHLLALPGASERLKLFSAGLQDPGSFDEAIAGCFAVFHVASPLPVGKGAGDPEHIVLKPAIEGTDNVLRTCAKSSDVKVVVVTSSMAAIAPQPEPEIKSEIHWSDPDEQKSRGSYYGASKTLAEQKAYAIAKDASFRLVSICPTMVIGPMLQSEPNMTMLALRNWLKDGRANGQCPNDSMTQGSKLCRELVLLPFRECGAEAMSPLSFVEIDCVDSKFKEHSWLLGRARPSWEHTGPTSHVPLAYRLSLIHI